MKKLISYSLQNPAHKRLLQEYLWLQIDINLNWWRPHEILIYLNFPFEYRGVVARPLPPEAKGTMTKWFAIREALRSEEKVWCHDHDGWQVAPAPPPVTCKPIHARCWATEINSNSKLPSTCSFMVHRAAQPVVSSFVDNCAHMEAALNYSDELLFSMFTHANPAAADYVDFSLPVCYGCCRGEYRKLTAVDLPLFFVHEKLGVGWATSTASGVDLGISKDIREMVEGRKWDAGFPPI